MASVAETPVGLEQEVAQLLGRIGEAVRAGDRGEVLRLGGAARELRERASAVLFERMAASRPEIVTAGGERRSVMIRRALHEARERARAHGCVTCPAAQLVGPGRVRCGVERSLVEVATDPMALISFCMGDYTACPSWRAEKEREAHGPAAPLVPVGEGV